MILLANLSARVEKDTSQLNKQGLIIFAAGIYFVAFIISIIMAW